MNHTKTTQAWLVWLWVNNNVRPHNMLELITSRGKRLLIIAMVTPWLFLVVYYGTPLLNSQTRHLRAVRAHIEKISPDWDQFRAQHRGFDQVTLFAYTGGDGMFGAHGYVDTDQQLTELRRFMESTVPPRPVFLEFVRVFGLEPTNNAEQGAAANGSQPFSSDTNRTSSAAGSRRWALR
jgi:hypothetical protein